MATKIRSFAIFDPKNQTGSGHVARIGSDELKKLFTIATKGMGAGDTITVKVQGSLSDSQPDFAAAANSTNQWTYLAYTDRDTNVTTAGSTGLSFTAADGVKTIEVDTEGIQWLTLAVTTITDVANTSVVAVMTPFDGWYEPAAPNAKNIDSPIGITIALTKVVTKLPREKELTEDFGLTAESDSVVTPAE